MNIQKEKETPQTRKAIIMKKNTISALYTYFVKNDTTTDLSAAIEDIRAEYEKSAAKSQAKANADFFEAACKVAGKKAREMAKPIANLVLNDFSAYVNAHEGIDFATTAFTPERGVQLVELLAADTISSKQAKEVFAAVLDEDKDPNAIVEERGMKQVSDTGAIEAVVDEVLAANPDKVEQYKGGKTGLIGFFVGQCMKAMKGQGNPKLINEMLAKKLS